MADTYLSDLPKASSHGDLVEPRIVLRKVTVLHTEMIFNARFDMPRATGHSASVYKKKGRTKSNE
jgi:hypothetical protein